MWHKKSVLTALITIKFSKGYFFFTFLIIFLDKSDEVGSRHKILVLAAFSSLTPAWRMRRPSSWRAIVGRWPRASLTAAICYPPDR